MASIAYYILTQSLLLHPEQKIILNKALGKDRKGKLSILVYAIAIAIAFFSPKISMALYFLVAIMWLAPDKRLEKTLNNSFN